MEKYQTLGRRFLALIIDWILIGLGTLIISFVLRIFFESDQTMSLMSLAATSVLKLTTVFYFILLHYRYGQTIGKKAVDVKVVDDSELPINFGQAVLRSLHQLIPTLFTVTLSTSYYYPDESTQIISAVIFGAAGVFNIVDIVVFLTNDKRRALHDFIAGTVVVNTN